MVRSPQLLTPASAAGGALVWRCEPGSQAISSAAVGGGRNTPKWVVNIGVESDYARTDLDAHASEVARELGLDGDGIALFTSAQLAFCRSSEVDGVIVDCTAGIGKPTFAASPNLDSSEWSPGESAGQSNAPRTEGADLPPGFPGTINIVATLPRSLTEAAAVNAVMTLTEAKTQALCELGVPGTGTASDAAVVVWPSAGEPEAFCGPRSFVGSRLANATYQAVRASAIATHPHLRSP